MINLSKKFSFKTYTLYIYAINEYIIVFIEILYSKNEKQIVGDESISLIILISCCVCREFLTFNAY